MTENKKKIMVAEDDPHLCKIYKIKLQSAGFDVQICENGEELMAAIVNIKPDLILLDLLMPKKDGYQVLQELKGNDQWKAIPVLITTNVCQEVEEQKLIALGAADYVVKSNSSLDQLIERMNKVLPS